MQQSETEAEQSNIKLIKRLVTNYLKPYSGQLAVTVFFMFLASAAVASFAKILQPVLDKALIGIQDGSSNINDVWPMAGFIFGCFFVSGLATYIHVIKMNKISQSIVADIQKDVFSHFMKLELSFFHLHPSGQLVSRITNDVNVMRAAVSDSVTSFGKYLITLILLLGVMIWQDWKLALIALTIFPAAVFLINKIGKRLRRISHSIQSENAKLMETLIGIFQGIRQVQAYGMEEYEKERSGRAVNTVRDLNIKSVRVGNLSTPVNEILVGCIICIIIGFGAYRISQGELTPGGLISFIAAFILAYEPIKKLAKLNNSLQIGLGAADRILTMLDIDPKIISVANSHQMEAKVAEIEFKNVSFSYDLASEEKALHGINLIIDPGKTTALVGPSGSGKTTILNLVPRFYDVTDGIIEINGVDIRNYSISSLRKNIALVSQDITIFDDSVSANISYGTTDASHEQIKQAAKAAAADIFIEQMPDRYETRLGENGVKLSGGQKQRIAIARAILRDAPILLLDEATSALDNESEQLIQKTLAELQKGRTTLVIAHRLSTIREADKIIVLEKGNIVEQGSHDSLLKKSGLYTRLYNSSLSE